jgi:prolyl-tRNA synthetase
VTEIIIAPAGAASDFIANPHRAARGGRRLRRGGAVFLHNHAMKASQTFVSTLKEAPADAEIVSHKLMMRAGMIKRLGAGIYSYMPMGLRVIRKVEAIIREEMNRAGAVELLMPVVQPAELWQETGRFQAYGPELMRVKDRHDATSSSSPPAKRSSPTSRARNCAATSSCRENFYHIQTKFRDERRPRFGVMRGREFTMKDAYSFDRDLPSAMKSYNAMFAAYQRIFDRFGLTYRAVAADTGSIGGDASHEFQVIADTGEDAIVYCPTATTPPTSSWPRPAAAAASAPRQPGAGEDTHAGQERPVPTWRGCWACRWSRTVKSLVLATDEKDEAATWIKTTVWLLLVRGDHSLNEVKAGKVDGLKDGFRFATGRRDRGPLRLQAGLPGPDRHEEAGEGGRRPHGGPMSDFVCGANEADFHHTGVQLGPRPARARPVADIRNVVGGDPVARRQGPARDPARHRGRPCVPARHQEVQRADERQLPGRERQAAALRDGLLRHRRHALAGRGHRAEPRRARHRLAGQRWRRSAW